MPNTMPLAPRSQLVLMAQSCVSRIKSEFYQSEELTYADQMPGILQEPYIFTGYRKPFRPWKYYVLSILRFHNETINVWTHAGGFLILLLCLVDLLAGFDFYTEPAAWPTLAFGVCCLLNMVLSSTAHLLHSKSPWHHYVFFLLDYAGVTFYIFGTGLGSMFICSTKAFHQRALGWFLPSLVLSSWFAFFACCMAKIKLADDLRKRKLLMVAGVSIQGVFVALPTIARYAECFYAPSCRITSLNHITLVFCLVILCGVTFTAHVPERWMPGSFDVIGHGHQIFHVAAVLTMVAQFRAIEIEVKEMRMSRELNPNPVDMSIAFFSLVVAEGLTLLYFVQFIVMRHSHSDVKAKAS